MRYWSAVLTWSLQSLVHRPLRAGLTILGIGIAMALVLSVLGFYRGYRAALAENIERLGYQVLVTAKGCPYEAATMVLRGGVIPMYLDESVAADIAAEEDVETVTRFFLQGEPDPGTGRLQLYMGVDGRFLSLKPWIAFQRGEWFHSDNSDELILGYNVAEQLRARIGDVIRVRGHPMVVRGVLDRSGSQEDGTIFLPLPRAQKLFDKMGKLTGVGIRLRDLERLEEFSDSLYDIPSVQVVTLSQVQRTILGLLQTARWLMSTVAAVGLVIAVVGITNTVLMAVLERLPDLGVIRAVGGGRKDVFLLVWGEALVLSLAGAIGGTLLSFLTATGSEILLRSILPYAPSGTLIHITPREFLPAGGTILVLGLLAGLYPALRAVAVSPIRSIRA